MAELPEQQVILETQEVRATQETMALGVRVEMLEPLATPATQETLATGAVAEAEGEAVVDLVDLDIRPVIQAAAGILEILLEQMEMAEGRAVAELIAHKTIVEPRVVPEIQVLQATPALMEIVDLELLVVALHL